MYADMERNMDQREWLLLFDTDGMTTIVTNPRFVDNVGELGVSSHTCLIHGGKRYLVEVLCIGGEVQKCDDEWPQSRRARAIMKERMASGGKKAGGYLGIWPNEEDELEDDVRDTCEKLLDMVEEMNRKNKKQKETTETRQKGKTKTKLRKEAAEEKRKEKAAIKEAKKRKLEEAGGLDVYFDGLGQVAGETATPARQPCYRDHLSQAEKEMIDSQVDFLGEKKYNMSTQTDPVIILSSLDELTNRMKEHKKYSDFSQQFSKGPIQSTDSLIINNFQLLNAKIDRLINTIPHVSHSDSNISTSYDPSPARTPSQQPLDVPLGATLMSSPATTPQSSEVPLHSSQETLHPSSQVPPLSSEVPFPLSSQLHPLSSEDPFPLSSQEPLHPSSQEPLHPSSQEPLHPSSHVHPHPSSQVPPNPSSQVPPNPSSQEPLPQSSQEPPQSSQVLPLSSEDPFPLSSQSSQVVPQSSQVPPLSSEDPFPLSSQVLPLSSQVPLHPSSQVFPQSSQVFPQSSQVPLHSSSQVHPLSSEDPYPLSSQVLHPSSQVLPQSSLSSEVPFSLSSQVHSLLPQTFLNSSFDSATAQPSTYGHPSFDPNQALFHMSPYQIPYTQSKSYSSNTPQTGNSNTSTPVTEPQNNSSTFSSFILECSKVPFCSPAYPIVYISNPSDTSQDHTNVQYRVNSVLCRDAKLSSTLSGNFGWTLCRSLYEDEELVGHNFWGNRQKRPLSPRRRHAIIHALREFTDKNEQPLAFKQAVKSINQGIRNLEYKKNKTIPRN